MVAQDLANRLMLSGTHLRKVLGDSLNGTMMATDLDSTASFVHSCCIPVFTQGIGNFGDHGLDIVGVSEVRNLVIQPGFAKNIAHPLLGEVNNSVRTTGIS